MKKYSAWQLIQAILCFIILLGIMIPLGVAAITSPEMDMRLRIIFGAASVLGILCALRILVLMFTHKRRDKAGVALKNTVDGAIHISLPAIETLVEQGIRDVQGLSDVSMKITDHSDSITIDITMSACNEINIPETLMQLQARIKNYIQESAGVAVDEVRINVEEVILPENVQALPAGNENKMEIKPEAPESDASAVGAGRPEASEPEAEKPAPEAAAPEKAPEAAAAFENEPASEAGEAAPEEAEAESCAADAIDDDDDDYDDADAATDEAADRRSWFGHMNRRDAAEPEASAEAAEAPDAASDVKTASAEAAADMSDTGAPEADEAANAVGADAVCEAEAEAAEPDEAENGRPEAAPADAEEQYAPEAKSDVIIIENTCGETPADSEQDEVKPASADGRNTVQL